MSLAADPSLTPVNLHDVRPVPHFRSALAPLALPPPTPSPSPHPPALLSIHPSHNNSIGVRENDSVTNL